MIAVSSQPHNPRTRATAAWIDDGRHLRPLAWMVWALIVLMIVPDGFDYFALAGNGPTGSGGLLSRLLWLGLAVLGGAILLWRIRLARLLARSVNPFLLLFVALAFASVAWSADPELSVRRLIRLGTIMLATSGFVLMSWHAHRFQDVMRPVLTFMLAASIVFALAFPSLGIHGDAAPELAGAWRGLANHKNSFGALASLGLIFWCHARLAREASDWSSLWGAAVAVACLLLSRSATSMVATLLAIALLLVLLRTPRALKAWLPAAVWLFAALLLVQALALMNVVPHLGAVMEPVTALTGKDDTLTGRTQIWEILANHIRYHPLLGTGYGAYWTPDPVPGTDSYAYVELMGSFYPGSAHNGYLEVLNDLGWVGLTCLLGFILVYIHQCLRLFRVDQTQASLFLALFFQQAITNLSESHWFSVLSVDFVIMTLATMALARALLEYRLRLAFGRSRT